MPARPSAGTSAGQTGAVLLGAGFARRFGADKRLAPLGDSTVAATTLDRYCATFEHVRVVVRSEQDPLRVRCAHAVEWVVAPDARLGMGHSLAAGFAGLQWAYAFLGFTDMPFVRGATLAHLREQALTHRFDRIIRPRFTGSGRRAGAFGHPVGMPPALFGDLQACTGDEGARAVLAAHADRVVEVPCDDPGIVQDVDTPDDLIRTADR